MTILDPRALLAMLLGLGVSYGAGRLHQYHGDAKAFQGERTAAALDAASAQLKAVSEARIEEQRRTQKQSEIANDAKQQADTALADAGRARAESGRLRERIAALVAAGRATESPAATGGSQAAGDLLDVLADVLVRADQRAGDLAQYADAARIAGLACERSYAALTSD
ncbi:DUF2514 family protein [Ralstonia pseudosolanacearum]